MRSEVERLPTDESPQEGAHEPVAPSWHEWEPGHEGKAIVTNNGHVYTWSNGTPFTFDHEAWRPNGAYLPHTQFMRDRLGLDPYHGDVAQTRKWHYFELDPDGTVVPDSPEDKPGFPDALSSLANHHPGLNVTEANSKQWSF